MNLRTWYDDRIGSWFAALSQREQRLVLVAAGLVCIALLYLVLVLPFQTLSAQRGARVEQKAADLAWMREVAPQVAAAAASGATGAASGESLVVLVDRTARQAGLGSALRDQSPNGPNSLRLRMESASFDSLVTWLAELQQRHGVAIEAANIDVGSAPGLVNASVTIGLAAAG
jgi:general secretion pathway protein M